MHIYGAQVSAGSQSAIVAASLSIPAAGNPSAPVLSSPTDTVLPSNAADLSVTTDKGQGTLYWFVSTSATPPSAANLKAGTGAVAYGSQAVTSTGAQDITATGFSASTTYYSYFLHNDGTQDSSIAATDGFTTSSGTSYSTTDNFTYKSETVTFNQAVKIGQTLNGQYFVVSDTPGTTLVSFSTPSTTSGGLKINGAEFHPKISTSQGLSQRVASLSGTPGATNSTAYGNARNIDPGNTGSPYSIPVGASGRVVKVIDDLTPAGPWQLFSEIIHINIVPSVPPAGAIAPIYDDAGNVTWVTTASKSILAGCGYVSGQTTLAAAKAAGWMPDLDQPLYFTVAEQARPFYANSLITTGYSVDRATYYGRVMNAMHSEGSAGVSDADWYIMVNYMAGMVERAYRNLDNSGAGQFVGEAPFAHNLAMASGDAAIIAAFHAMEGNEVSQPGWIGDTEINQAPQFDAHSSGTNYYNRWPFLEIHRNRAHFRHSSNVASETHLLDSDVGCRYEDVAGGGGIIGYNNMALCQDVHGTGDGLTFLINGTNNTSNPKAAIPAYWRRERTFNADCSLSGSNPWGSSQDFALHDVAIAQSSVTPLTTTPDAFSPIRNQSNYLTAVAGGFRSNMTNAKQATETVTRWDYRYTLDDGISFFEDLDVGTVDYTKSSGMPVGVSIGIENRRWSASGAGPWSVIHPKQDSGGSVPGTNPRFYVTPSGTPSGTPTNAQAPVIRYKPISGYAGPYYEDTPALVNVPTGTVLYSGVGWWPSGDLTGGFSTEWFLDGVSQGVSDTYTTQLGDFNITTEVTCGGVTVASSNSVNPTAGGSLIDVVGYGSATRTATGAWSYTLSSLTAPGGGGVTLLQNDVIEVNVVQSGTTNRTQAQLTCTGYTPIHTDIYSNDNRDTNMQVQYKIMGASPDTTITMPANPSATQATTATIRVLRGVDTTTPLDVAAVTASGGNGRIANPGAITPLTTGALITTHAGGSAGGSSTGAYTIPADADASSGLFTEAHVGASSVSGRAASATYTLWASGAFNPAPFGIDDTDDVGDSWAAVTVAWRPA